MIRVANNTTTTNYVSILLFISFTILLPLFRLYNRVLNL